MIDGLFDPAKVDLVGVAVDGVVELFVLQDQPWTGSDAQLGSLQQKIHNYVAYALDGPMVDSYPEVAGMPWRIVVHSQIGEPDGRTSLMLEALREPLLRYGASLAVRTGSPAG
jgi:hypothetical protein